jgi:signal transduction histidine kinase
MKSETGVNASSDSSLIKSIRKQLLDRIMFFGLIAGGFAVAASFIRMSVTGFHFIYVLDALILISLVILVFGRTLIPDVVRFLYLVGLSLLIGSAGFHAAGLLGYGTIILLTTVILTAVFTNRHQAFLVIAIAEVVIITYAILYSNGIVSLTFDPHAYHRNPVSWINTLAGFGAISILLTIVVTTLIGNLASLSQQRNENLEKIKSLNETLEQKVGSRTAELAQSNRDRDRILGVVAHDIRNKLGGVIGYLDMLKDGYHDLPEENRFRYVSGGLKASLMANELIQELLEFARTQGEEQELITESVDLCSFVMSTIECHIPRALEKKIILKMGNTPEYAFCAINRAQLSRVIDNLVTNAIKFTSSGGEVTVDIEEEKDGVVVKVRDSGIGIPEALQSNVFKPFSNSRRAGTADEKSTGLGLSISKMIVERHSGRIWLESEEGRGSTFFLFLPRKNHGAPDKNGNSDKG